MAPAVAMPLMSSASLRTGERLDSRRSAGAWFGILLAAGLVIALVVALVVLVLQNPEPVDVTFLAWTGSVPLSLLFLGVAVGVGIVASVIGSLRTAQLRRRLAEERTITMPGRLPRR
ncbi:lipopolysaccharide assembly protein LapA domain-containing protein [Cellulomonas soli]|uniref:lipopolysaccharide assembly protein LapA domain-containing protein n=1 Tax=Cellulomonas soli TaxID=931535 RepID=UPI003F84EAAD